MTIETEFPAEPDGPDDLHRAANALLNTLWQTAYSGALSFEENWMEMDRRFPQARWLHNALKAAALTLKEAEPVAWTTQEQLDGIKGTGNNAVMWGEPLPYHPDIPLYTSPPLTLKDDPGNGEDDEVTELRARCEKAEAALEQIMSPRTVAGMHDQDRAPKLQAIAAAAIRALIPEGEA